MMKTLLNNHLTDPKVNLSLISLTPNQPLGRLPNWTRSDTPVFKEIVRSNRYLAYQEKRILNAIENRQYNRATLIWLMLLKNSKSYQMNLFTKVIPYWYHKYDVIQVRNLLERCMNKCRTQSLALKLSRFYIEKKNGKLRPIGCPNLESRIISRSINDLIMLQFSNKFSNHQHGYRKHRGAFTAIYKLLTLLSKEPEVVYEFDLDSYFNKVRPSWVYRSLLSRGQILAEYVIKILHSVEYKFPDGLMEEKEMITTNKFVTTAEGKKIPVLLRQGLPQGLSISPVLSTLAMEIFPTKEDIIMYADDGIYVGKDLKKFNSWLEMMSLVGVKLSKSKSKLVDKEFSFLGFKINRENHTISFEGETKSWNEALNTEWVKECSEQSESWGWSNKEAYVQKLKSKDRNNWLKSINTKYSKSPDKWTWNINKGSYLNLYASCNASIMDRIICVMISPWGKSYKGYRYWWGTGVVDILQSSSDCLQLLMERMKELNLKGIKPLRVVKSDKFKDLIVLKGSTKTRGFTYGEQIYENDLTSYGKKAVPGWKNLFINFPSN